MFTRNRFQPEWPTGYWPDQRQRWLLEACLLPDETRSLDAWRNWRAITPWDTIDAGSLHLLPLLRDKLTRLQAPNQDAQRLNGVTRYQWAKAAILSQTLGRVRPLLAAQGIEMMLLKGAAMNHAGYSSVPRMMNDLDVLVRRRDAVPAIETLLDAGWRPVFRDWRDLLDVTHGLGLVSPEGSELDVHWGLFSGRVVSQADEDAFWTRATVSKQIHLLCPEDQFLHICQHGAQYNETPPFRWLADCHAILQSTHDRFDFDRLFTQAERYDFVRRVAQTLDYLRTHLNADIPKDVLAAAHRRKPSLAERVENYVAQTRGGGSHPFWSSMGLNLVHFRRLRQGGLSISRSEFLRRVNFFEVPVRAYWRELVRSRRFEMQTALQAKVSRWFNWRDRQRWSVAELPEHRLTGMYPATVHQSTLFRWTCAKAEMQLPIPPGDTLFRLRVHPLRSWDNDLSQSFRAFVNQTEIPRASIRCQDHVIEFTAPANTMHAECDQRIVIGCQPWQAAQDDPRDLGLPVKSIEVAPAPHTLQWWSTTPTNSQRAA